MNLLSLFESYTEENKARIVAYGSSVVERLILGTHWLDYLELTLMRNVGRIHTCLNCGRYGDTTRDLINRVDRDVIIFEPNITFLKIGGNDTASEVCIGSKEFRNNICYLIDKLQRINSKVVLLTYHIPKEEEYGQDRADKLYEFMEIIREVSKEKEAFLVDSMRHWKRLHDIDPSSHKLLLLDEIHLSELGNLFQGISMSSDLGLNQIAEKNIDWIRARKIFDMVQRA